MTLTCEQFKERLANQEMSPAEARELQSHLESCPACKQAAEDYQELRERLAHGRKEAAAAIPAGGWDNFENRLLASVTPPFTQTLPEPKMKRPLRLALKRTGYGIAAAIALAATGVLGNLALKYDGGMDAPMARSKPLSTYQVGSAAPIFEKKQVITKVIPYVDAKISDYTITEEGIDGTSRRALRTDASGNPVAHDVDLVTEVTKDSSRHVTTADTADQMKVFESTGRSEVSATTPPQINFDLPGGVGSISGFISGSGSITKSGAGTITLSGAGASTYTGGTTISGGTLVINTGGIVPSTKYYDSETTDRAKVAGVLKGGLTKDLGIAAAPPVYFSVPQAEVAMAPGQKQAEDRDLNNERDAKEGGAIDLQQKLRERPGSSPQGRPLVADIASESVATHGASTPVAQPPAAGDSGVQSTGNTQAVAELKIIRNGTVEFEVRSFDDSYRMIVTVAKEEAGYVSSTSSDKLANGKVQGSIVVRVPPQNLDTFLLKIRALGELKSLQLAAQDVTKQYTDLDSELRALRAMESRLIDLIKNGKGEVKDLVEAEKQLGTYRVRIETIEGEMRYYNSLVSMATVTITAYEKDIQTPTAASEQENVALNLETEDVETRYTDARKILDDAKGRIVESELKKHDADQFAAHIVADVPPDKADFVAAQLKQLGKVAGYNRDKKQTTTGGEGVPTVEVTHKDTRFTIEMYNLANIAPRETAVLTLAVNDVEATYKKVIAQVRQTPKPADDVANASAKLNGRVVSSDLAGEKPELMTADLRADIRAENADALIQSLRDSGEVLASSTVENPDTANVTAAKRGLQLRLVNIASVAPREASILTIAVPDVEASYQKILQLLHPAAPQKQSAAVIAQTRVISSSLNGLQPEQMTADLRAELKSEDVDNLLAAIKSSGEIMTASRTAAPENTTATWSKRGLQLHLVSIAAVPARETRTMRLVASDVPKAYATLTDKLQDLASQGAARIIDSNLNENNPQAITASLAFEINRDKLSDAAAALQAAGIEAVAKNVTRSTDTLNTLDSKVRFQVESLFPADLLSPRRVTTLGIEVDDVQKALDSLRPASGSPVKEVAFTLNKDKTSMTGHIVLDMPVADSMAVLAKIHDLGGTEKVNQVVKNTQVPDTRFSKEQIDVTLINKDPLVESGSGIGASAHAALGTSLTALIRSFYWVIVGVIYLAPWLLLAWLIAKFRRRHKKAPASPTA